MFPGHRIAQLSFFFFREEVFSLCVVAGIVDPGRRGHRPRLQANEVDRTNILAPGFVLLPAFTPDLSGTGLIGKSYPVTAAQLLPSFTGFLAPIHFFKLAKNWDEE